jgi:hypothetical protein
VESHGARVRAVAFGTGGRLPRALDGPADGLAGAIQATFTLEVNEWNGVSEPRLVLRRAQPVQELRAEGPIEEIRAGALVAKAGAGEIRAAENRAGEPAGTEELVLFAL